MWHLDEGTLQAWLDQARSGMSASVAEAVESHLTSCEACAARLGELDGLTSQARSILSSVVPVAGDPPDYRVVFQRAQAAGYVSRRRRTWTVPAWAASVVLAIGVGWMSNEAVRGRIAPAPTSPATVPEEAAREVVDVPAPARIPAAGSVGGPEIALPPTGVPSAEPALAGGRDVPPRAEGPAVAPPSLSAAAVPDAAAPAPSVAAPRAQVAPPSPPPAAVPAGLVVRGRVVDAESGAPIPATQVFIAERDIGVLTAQDGTFTLLLPRAAGAGSAQMTLVAQRMGYGQMARGLTVRSGDTLIADITLTEQALMLDEVIVTGTPSGAQRRAIGNSVTVAGTAANGPRAEATMPGVAWTALGRDAAEARAGFGLLTVPDLPVRGIDVGTLDDAPVVRVLQDLTEGALLTLFLAESELGPSRIGGAGGAAATVARRDGVWVLGSAPLTADSLAVLLERLR